MSYTKKISQETQSVQCGTFGPVIKLNTIGTALRTLLGMQLKDRGDATPNEFVLQAKVVQTKNDWTGQNAEEGIPKTQIRNATCLK